MKNYYIVNLSEVIMNFVRYTTYYIVNDLVVAIQYYDVNNEYKKFSEKSETVIYKRKLNVSDYFSDLIIIQQL